MKQRERAQSCSKAFHHYDTLLLHLNQTPLTFCVFNMNKRADSSGSAALCALWAKITAHFTASLFFPQESSREVRRATICVVQPPYSQRDTHACRHAGSRLRWTITACLMRHRHSFHICFNMCLNWQQSVVVSDLDSQWAGESADEADETATL